VAFPERLPGIPQLLQARIQWQVEVIDKTSHTEAFSTDRVMFTCAGGVICGRDRLANSRTAPTLPPSAANADWMPLIARLLPSIPTAAATADASGESYGSAISVSADQVA